MHNLMSRALALLLLAAIAPASASDAPKGSLVIAGGALRPDNAQVWERIVELAGGKGAAIAVFPTAAANPERSGAATADVLHRYGARAFVVPLSERLAASDVRAVAEDRALARRVRDAGGVFFTGGDQGRITAALRRADGVNSALLDAVWDVYRRGGVVAGTSAGAAIMSSTMFYDAPPGVFPVLADGVRDGKEIAPGLGFIGDDVFIDQHLLVRGRFARMLPAMLAKRYRLGLGVDENTALVVSPKREVTVVGYKGAVLLDLSAVSVDTAAGGFNVSNASISYLDAGDRYNIATGAFVPGPDKERLDPARPYLRGPLFYADILANTTVADLLEKLVDSDQASATGLAIGGPQAPGHGFEFRFTRTPASEGYRSTRAEAGSAYRIRLDVRPVRIAQPLYTGG